MSRARALEIVRQGQRFLVTCHRRPDADALGSALGWAAILRTLGKEATVFSVDPAPRTLRYLKELDEVVAAPRDDVRWDACFVMDAAAGALVPEMPPSLAGPVVMFDHHAAHDDYGDVIVREPDACATGLLVIRMMHDLGIERIPPAAAKPLYAALVADTGGFRYNGTSPEAFRVAAELVEAGAEPWPTAYHLFEGFQPARLKLLGAVLEEMEILLDGRVALLPVTRALLERVGADDEMVEGLVNYGRSLEGVEVAALIWELSVGERLETKVSLRASGSVDVSRVAAALGGGGHVSAAGANLAEDLRTTRERVLARLADALGPVPA